MTPGRRRHTIPPPAVFAAVKILGDFSVLSEYLWEYIPSNVHFLTRNAARSPRLIRLCKQHLPYCLVPRPKHPDQFIILNRNYKPLGWPANTRAWVDYDSPEFDLFSITMPTVFEPRLPIFFYCSPDNPWASKHSLEKYKIRLFEVLGPLDFNPQRF